MTPPVNEPEGSNTALPAEGKRDHDRVAMLSLRADGTPDQYDPEFIGDKDASLAATKEQFKQQAVSAADTELRANQGGLVGYEVEDAPQDPTIEKLEKAHEEVAKNAESAAEKAVESLSLDRSEQTSEAVDPSPEERRETAREAADQQSGENQ